MCVCVYVECVCVYVCVSVCVCELALLPSDGRSIIKLDKKVNPSASSNKQIRSSKQEALNHACFVSIVFIVF